MFVSYNHHDWLHVEEIVMSYLERECCLQCCIVDRDVAEMGDESDVLSPSQGVE